MLPVRLLQEAERNGAPVSGRDHIDMIVEREREEAFSEVDGFNGLERLADALSAEAALPARNPDWVKWAREQVKVLRRMSGQLQRFCETYRRGID